MWIQPQQHSEQAFCRSVNAKRQCSTLFNTSPIKITNCCSHRCLTCDQPVKSGPSGAPSPASRGAFLPRLDSMPQRDSSGININITAAELRRNAEQHKGGGTRVNSPPRPLSGDMDEYLNIHYALAGGDGRHSSPNRKGTAGGVVNPATASGRVPVVVTAGKQLASGAGRTPVFI